MEYLTSLLDFDGKKTFKKDLQSEEINVEIYLEKSIKWLGLLSLALAVIAQLINEVSGTDMKCFPDRNAGFQKGSDWMKDQMELSKAFGEYADVHCATVMIDYGPLVPNENVSTAGYTRQDIVDLATNKVTLPWRRCLESQNDELYCQCEAKWKDDGEKGKNPCKKPCLALPCTAPAPTKTKTKAPPAGAPAKKKSVKQRLLDDEIKYREEMFHHYFPWFLLMQSIFFLMPQHLWNTLFSEKILFKLLKVHECTETPSADLHKVGKELLAELSSLRYPKMTVFFVIKQVYYIFGGIYLYSVLYKWVGYGIQENQVTRCLIEEYSFMICASPANGAIWFVYAIDSAVMIALLVCAVINLTLMTIARFRKNHLRKDFLKELLDKLFQDKAEMKAKLETVEKKDPDYPFFSRICQENKHIFGDIYISLKSRNEITSVSPDALETIEEIEEEVYINAIRQRMTVIPEANRET